MISPVNIRQQALRWWPDVLRAGMTGDAFFPKKVHNIGKVKGSERLSDFERIREEQQALVAQSKSEKGYGYRLHWEERDFRKIGRNRFISAISFEGLEDYLAFLSLEKKHAQIMANEALVREAFPQLSNWLLKHVGQLEKQQGHWPEIIQLCRFMLESYDPYSLFPREVPLLPHSKFMENRAALFRSLLDALLPPERIDERFRGTSWKSFAQRFRFKTPAAMLRIRFLDQAIADQYFSGISNLSMPVVDFAKLDIPIQRVLIFENKTSFSSKEIFQCLPQTDAMLTIFGSGFGIERLKNIAWLQHCDICYWGDIDTQGLQILSRLRSYLPHTRAILMDASTFDTLQAHHTEGTATNIAMPPNLLPEEQQLYARLRVTGLRLEQEFVPLPMVREAFE